MASRRLLNNPNVKSRKERYSLKLNNTLTLPVSSISTNPGPQGSIIFNQSDGRLYISNGEDWTVVGSTTEDNTLSPDGAIGDSRFGAGLDITADGQTLIVLAPDDNNEVGAAYIFDLSTTVPTQIAKLIPSDASSGLELSSVGISTSGEYAALAEAASASVWVFRNISGVWTETQKITPPETFTRGSVIVSGTAGITGGEYFTLTSSQSNSYYVWLDTNGDGTTQDPSGPGTGVPVNISALVLPNDAGVASAIASALTALSDIVADTATSDTTVRVGTISAIADFDTGFTISSFANSVSFGVLTLNDNYLAISDILAPGEVGVTDGTVYIYELIGTTFQYQERLTANDIILNTSFPLFGTSLALENDDTIAISAINDEDNRGSVFVFRESGGTWSQDPKITSTNANGPITTVRVLGGPGLTGGEYFIIGSGTTQYYVWMDTIGDGTTQDPGATGTGVPVDISGGQTNSEVATAIVTAVDGLSDFSSEISLEDNVEAFLIQDDPDIPVVSSTDFDTGFTITFENSTIQLGLTLAYSGDFIYASGGDPILVNTADEAGTRRGAIYAFSGSGTELDKLLDSFTELGLTGDRTFSSIATPSDGSIIVGGIQQEDNGNGGFRVFDRSGNIFTQRNGRYITQNTISSSQQGFSVAIESGTVVIGRPNDNYGVGTAGIVNESDLS